MRITFKHPHARVPRGLKAAASEKVEKLDRFLPGMERAEILYGFEKTRRVSDSHTCEVTILGHGHVVRAKAVGPDQLSALDKVIDRLEHRLTKLKGRLVDRKHPHHGARRALSDVRSRTGLDDVRPSKRTMGKPPSRTSPNDRPAPAPTEATRQAAAEAKVVKTKRFALEILDPSEAAMRMELVDHAFYLFTNSETGTAAVVYRREDGEVGMLISDIE